MVLRLWTEPGDRLRVRITRTADVHSDVGSTTYAATRGEVLEQVGDWLDGFVTPR